jgi:uncharacterized MAPEG superfamily protein
MTIPVAVLLAFAAWTIATLAVAIGWFRWSRILTRRAGIHEFEGGAGQPTGWSLRAHRAHANCLENLPLYTAVVVSISVTGATHPALDPLALALIAARVGQTLTHVVFDPTARAVSVRFSFFLMQLACMVAMGVIAARSS